MAMVKAQKEHPAHSDMYWVQAFVALHNTFIYMPEYTHRHTCTSQALIFLVVFTYIMEEEMHTCSFPKKIRKSLEA